MSFCANKLATSGVSCRSIIDNTDMDSPDTAFSEVEVKIFVGFTQNELSTDNSHGAPHFLVGYVATWNSTSEPFQSALWCMICTRHDPFDVRTTVRVPSFSSSTSTSVKISVLGCCLGKLLVEVFSFLDHFK